MERKNQIEGFSFLTTDMLEKHKKQPYTKREILQREYPDFWDGANELVRILRELQNLLVELLSLNKQGLPKAFAKLEDDKSQEFFLNYIKYRVLYAFAEIVWKRTERHCKNIAMSPGNNDSAKNALLHSFKVFDDYPIIDVVSNDEQGYDIMNELIDNYEPRIDFGVLQYWSYRDIVGSIQSQGFKDEQLWKDVIDAPEPTKASIGELLDDNQTMRLY